MVESAEYYTSRFRVLDNFISKEKETIVKEIRLKVNKALKIRRKLVKQAINYFNNMDVYSLIICKDDPYCLNIKFEDKDKVKFFGCKFDSGCKRWYIPYNISSSDFMNLIKNENFFTRSDIPCEIKDLTRTLQDYDISWYRATNFRTKNIFTTKQLNNVYNKLLSKEVSPVLNNLFYKDLTNLIISYIFL
jgi:hypothetical protein